MEKQIIRSFRKRLRQFERLTAHQLKEDSCCQGVTLAQCHTLLEIEELGQASIVTLTKRLGLDKSTLSRTIDGLVNISLVERIAHPSDRRFVLLTLTDQGRSICRRINRLNDEYYSRVFDGIAVDKHEDVITYFDMLVSALQRYQKDKSKNSACKSNLDKGK